MSDEPEAPPQLEREDSSGLPPYVPPSTTAGNSLMDEIMKMKNQATSGMSEINAKSEEIGKKVTRVRRKSRDLEEMMFGMEIKDKEMLKTIFEKLDVTKDGNIDRSELKAALEEAGRKVTQEQADEIFKSLDTDGNNLLDFKEFQKAFLKCD